MSRRSNVPVNASLLRSIRGTITAECENKGKTVTVSLFASYESMGWKTNYTAVPCQHVVIRIAGKTVWAQRYSGARLDRAAKVYDKAVADCRRIAQLTDQLTTPEVSYHEAFSFTA